MIQTKQCNEQMLALSALKLPFEKKGVLRIVAIICTECSIILEYIMMTALLGYLDLFINSNSCKVVQLRVTMGSSPA